ncbi:MAG: GtrA family protein [Carboxydocellales bacterium]
MVLTKIENKFIRFLIVGGVNTLFGYSVYAIFLFFNFHYSIATLLSVIIGILFNFKTTGNLVFENKENILIFKFFGVYSIIYILNVVGLKIFDALKINLYLAGILLILPTAIISFHLNKRYVFKQLRD